MGELGTLHPPVCIRALSKKEMGLIPSLPTKNQSEDEDVMGCLGSNGIRV